MKNDCWITNYIKSLVCLWALIAICFCQVLCSSELETPSIINAKTELPKNIADYLPAVADMKIAKIDSNGSILYNLILLSQQRMDEKAFAYDDTYVKLSDYQKVRRLSSDRANDAFGIDYYKRRYSYINKNVNSPRRLTSENKSILISYAKNLEKFLTDPEYKCRRPSLYKYFANFFGHSLVENTSSCEVFSGVLTREQKYIYWRNIDYNKVIRVDYGVAGRGEGIVSGFGHSVLRLVVCREIPRNFQEERECINDYDNHVILSFAAHIDDLVMSHLKGFLGGYNVMLSIVPFFDYIATYLDEEFRDIDFYPLKLNSKQIQMLVTKAIEMYWSYAGDYKFINNNCAVETHNLIQSSLVASDKNESTILDNDSIFPMGLIDIYRKEGLISIADKSALNKEKNNSIKSSKEYFLNTLKKISQQKLQSIFQSGISSTDQGSIDEDLLQKLIKELTPSEHRTIFENGILINETQDPLQNFYHTKEALLFADLFISLELSAKRFFIKEFESSLLKELIDSQNGGNHFENGNNGELYQQFVKIRDHFKIEKIASNNYGIPLVSEVVLDVESRNKLAKRYQKVIDKIKEISYSDELERENAYIKNIAFFRTKKNELFSSMLNYLYRYIHYVLDRNKNYLANSVGSKNDKYTQKVNLDNIRNLIKIDNRPIDSNLITDKALEKIVIKYLGQK